MLDRHEKEGTISSVRNALAVEADSEWLCFLDADDELGPGFIGAMRRALERKVRGDGTPPLLTPAVSYVRKGRHQPARFLPGDDLSENNYLVVGTLVQPRPLPLGRAASPTTRTASRTGACGRSAGRPARTSSRCGARSTSPTGTSTPSTALPGATGAGR